MAYDSNNPNHKKRNKAYQAKWYAANKDKQIKRSSARRDKVRGQAQDAVYAYLAEHPCVDCGEGRVVTLEFDHLPCFKKGAGISKLINDCRGLDVIFEEISKCEVVCRNCHAVRTAQRAGWKKLKY